MAYLFDCCPADFRAYGVLRKHPVVLAQFASHFVAGQTRAMQEGLAAARTALQAYVEPRGLDEASEAWLDQAARLVRTRRAVGLIEDALRGGTFTPKL